MLLDANQLNDVTVPSPFGSWDYYQGCHCVPLGMCGGSPYMGCCNYGTLGRAARPAFEGLDVLSPKCGCNVPCGTLCPCVCPLFGLVYAPVYIMGCCCPNNCNAGPPCPCM